MSTQAPTRGCALALAVFSLTSSAASAAESEAPVQKPTPLEQELQELESERLEKKPEAAPLDRALADAPAPAVAGGDIWSKQLGPVNLRFLDLSADLLFAAGSSTATDEELQSLEGGDHDPRKRGFTIQNVELSLTGAVDPYFNAELHIVYFLDPLEGESVLELEEAFLTTNELPFGLEEYGLQLEAGQFFTEFGRINPVHPHAWDWVDQSVINSRVFGPDGLRGPGLRLGWLTPLPWFSEVHLGMQNANGETMASFFSNEELAEERPIGGRPFVDQSVRDLGDFTYLTRWDNSWDLSETVTTKLGGSAVFGPNSTGADGDTIIYGADFLLRWRPLDNDHGWPFVNWQSEIIKRDYDAAAFLDEGADPVDPADDVLYPQDDLEDWGLYTQLLYGFVRNWGVGVRYEYASGSGASLGPFTDRSEDPFRDDRHRVAPLILWSPTHFSRIRLQYNYDRAEHLSEDDAHSVWLGFEALWGKHPAHTY